MVGPEPGPTSVSRIRSSAAASVLERSSVPTALEVVVIVEVFVVVEVFVLLFVGLFLVVIGNDLYAGGLFATINSLNTGSIARWDGTNWFPLGTGVEGDSPTVYALAAQGNELLAGGSFSIAGVKPSTLFARWLLPDVPPIVAMTSPTPNSIFTVGANLDLNVDASDTNDPVSQVAYYAGPTLIGVSSTPPYSFTWSNVFTGDYTLYAAATDGSGQTTFSGPVPITVVPPTNDIPPSVHFISPDKQ